MKPKNFPARKLKRQLLAQFRQEKSKETLEDYKDDLKRERDRRTKKKRASKRR